MPRITDIRSRKGTASAWASANPVLSAGEPGYTTDTHVLKLGDGTSTWKNLPAYMAKMLDTVSDDVAIEHTFNVNKISATAGVKMNVPTHISNPGQTTHPSVLFFPDGWGSPVKWKYWMAHTPYPAGNDDHEDPCIAVSNNGISWQTPVGVTNPLEDADGTPEYHSDVDLKMGPNNTMYMFYRWYSNIGNGGTEEKLRYISTVDGINWTSPTDFLVSNHLTRRIMSPTMVFEDDKWTMWGVDILSTPNRVIRMVSTDSTPEGSWGTMTYPSHNALPAGKEPWHIFMIKFGGKYFGLLNTCDLDQNGANGELHFMQSYDGSVFESSLNTVVPMYQAGQHDQVYRSTMIPAFENGQFGFRLFYTGWTDGTIVWNLYRSFLRSGGTPYELPEGTEVYAPLAPSGWESSGSIIRKNIGSLMQYEFDITVKRATGSATLPITSTAFVTVGVVVPPEIRALVDIHTRYLPGWLYGGSPMFNVHTQIFINLYTGAILIKLQNGTANMTPGVGFSLNLSFSLPSSDVPA